MQKELDLWVSWVDHSWDFMVDRELVSVEQTLKFGISSSVLYLRDWPYTPWPREGDNILW